MRRRNFEGGGGGAKKRLENRAGAESTRIDALLPKIKVRRAETAGSTGTGAVPVPCGGA